ncbi:PH-domain-containing protein [Teratosphaeria nubilosa]|uniref:PH-domain-containing protein n=1 Tax=Teratosphaeria nubilosa TaxID=161662 RepID=A0A6G1KYU7_9PEZI|nr:PH-domain-containing protein [Teratosphaeria nubilosa]
MTALATSSQAQPYGRGGLYLKPDRIELPSTSHTERSSKLFLDTLSPVTQNGSFEFDRIIKSGEVLKRKRRTKSWKPVFLVLRPNLLSIYRDKHESKLRHQINLSDLTAVARQKDPKRKEKHVFGLFSPSRNFHMEARSEEEASDWVEMIRREARIDRDEEEMSLASPGGAESTFRGFGRSIDAQISPMHDDKGYSSSDAEIMHSMSHALPKARKSRASAARQPSQAEYSGADQGSYSDFSDSAVGPAARISALSLAHTEGRPSTSSNYPPASHSIYGQHPVRPSMGVRSTSQLSGCGISQDLARGSAAQNPHDSERVVFQGYIYLLKSTRGVRSWKRVWMVLRPKALALYKTEEEYTPLLIIPFNYIYNVVEIDPISRSKTTCLQVIGEERNYRFCALDEESLARWLGAFKSLLSKRRAERKEKEASKLILPEAVAVQPPTPSHSTDFSVAVK